MPPFVVVALTVAMAACGPKRGVSTVEWRGHAFHEVTTLTDLPPAIRSQLGEGSGFAEIADRDECFNPTDVGNGCPTRRFLVAGRAQDTWLVALERGGRGHHVEVLLFSLGAVAQKWVLFEPPATLEELVQQISKQEAQR